MSELIQSVKNGEIQKTNNSSETSTSEKAGGELGKDAFLQLLVTQMRYQDPLNPMDNTEYISQLATFSQLEQMQNMSSSLANTQAFSLVGQNVILKTNDSTSDASGYVTGKVDYVYVTGTTTKLSVNGKLYSYDQLDTVLDNDYVVESNLPSVTEAKLEYDGSSPKDQSFTVTLGAGDTIANQVAVLIGETKIDSSNISLADNKVTINKEAFRELENGSYKVSVIFNDSLYTVVDDELSLTVKNQQQADKEEVV